MKVECVKEKIRNAVSFAERITGKNLSLPVLGAILVSAKGKSIKLRATNLDIGLELEVPAKVSNEGVAAVPGGILNTVLGNLYADSVSIELQGNNIVLTTKNDSVVVHCLPHDDFPTLPRISDGKAFTINGGKFVDGLKSVWFTASLSDIKPEIASVYVYEDGEELVFAATDSFRLAEKRVPFPRKEREDKLPPMLIPLKNVSEIIRVLEAVSGNIDVAFNSNQVAVTSDSLYLTSRLVDGIFPDYKQIIPKEFVADAVLLKQDFANALKLANLFSDKTKQIDMKIDPAEKIFKISSKNANVGEDTSSLEGALSGEAVELSFNQKYLFDSLQSLSRDSVSLKSAGESRPLVIESVGDRSFLYLVMPLNQ